MSTRPGKEEISALARKAGLRLTPQRLAVLETLLDSCDHPTAARICERTRRRVPGISRATVYNALETLNEAGLINRLHLDHASSRYCPNLVPHVHLLNESTGEVTDIRLKAGLRAEDVFELPEGVCITGMEACLRGQFSAKTTHSAT